MNTLGFLFCMVLMLYGKGQIMNSDGLKGLMPGH
jgi:hypothetical protein